MLVKKCLEMIKNVDLNLWLIPFKYYKLFKYKFLRLLVYS